MTTMAIDDHYKVPYDTTDVIHHTYAYATHQASHQHTTVCTPTPHHSVYAYATHQALHQPTTN